MRVGVVAARRVSQPSLRVTGSCLTSTECAPHDKSAKEVDWEVSCQTVIGKVREDWAVMTYAGS